MAHVIVWNNLYFFINAMLKYLTFSCDSQTETNDPRNKFFIYFKKSLFFIRIHLQVTFLYVKEVNSACV